MLHLCAGPDQGFALGRAMKQYGRIQETEHLLEVDLLRGEQHDMLSDTGIYASLLTVALQGKLHAVVGGPSCRSRSVLRHYPLLAGRPRPIRKWGGFEHGIEGLDASKKQMIIDGDVMSWRLVYLYMDPTSRRQRGRTRGFSWSIQLRHALRNLEDMEMEVSQAPGSD